jgi:hypothetical protein
MLVADGVFACRERWDVAGVRGDRGADARRPAWGDRAGDRAAGHDRAPRGGRSAWDADKVERRRDGGPASRSGRTWDLRAGRRSKGARDDGSEADERALAPMLVASCGLVAEVDGFNLHAGVRVAADDRSALERLCRYMARPAVAAGRVTRLPDGNVAYRVKSPRSAGATHRVMTPMEFMASAERARASAEDAFGALPRGVRANSPWRVRGGSAADRGGGAPCPGAASPEHAKEQAALPEAKGASETAAPVTPKRSSDRIDWAEPVVAGVGRRRASMCWVRRTVEDDRSAHRASWDRAHPGASGRAHRGAQDAARTRRSVMGRVR